MKNITEKTDEIEMKNYAAAIEDDYLDDDEDEQSIGGQFSKPWSELTFADNFLFCKIMEDENICRQFLEILLPIKIERIEYLNTEKEFNPSYKGRSIRLDVFVKDSNRIFDIEMQSSHFSNLSLRARYYQGAMDVSLTKKKTKFSKLKESYILFICKGDPFGQNIPVYTVKQTFFEKPEYPYNDRTHKVFYNSKAYKSADDKDLRGLLEFIQTNKASTDFSRKLKENVKVAKLNSNWEDEYMFFSDYLEECKEAAERAGMKKGLEKGLAEGLEKGLAEGLEKGIAEGIEKGIAEGREKGVYEKSIESARNMLNDNLPEEKVSQYSGLSLDEVRKLALEIM